MLRYKRYRLLALYAFAVIFLLYNASRNAQWQHPPQFQDSGDKTDSGPELQREKLDWLPPKMSPLEMHKGESVVVEPATYDGGSEEAHEEMTTPSQNAPVSHDDGKESGLGQSLTHSVDKQDTALQVDLPLWEPSATEEAHVSKPPTFQVDFTTSSKNDVVHWVRPTEMFPVPTDSLIRLPAGKPKTIPKIQHAFTAESPAAKEKRESRLSTIKKEAMRAWRGYKTYAWMHDEVRPITKDHRDPFCGWAATLVDSLDMLWIMGLKDEFEEAVRAVKDIDFTTNRYQLRIPVFETTIRYLGGLIAAYDVSGGEKGGYKILLQKAVELAEILMGAFDTPNRMPILYYEWTPAAFARRRLASAVSSLAEMGSLTLEFTRLAQLTGEHKYYDAVARITDALEEYQNRQVDGTAFPGIFPDRIDASGCNRTASATSFDMATDSAKAQAASVNDQAAEPDGFPSGVGANTESATLRAEKARDLEFRITPGSYHGEPGKGEIHEVEVGMKAERQVQTQATTAKIPSPEVSESLRASSNIHAKRGPFDSHGNLVGWDCVPQNLTTDLLGATYSMGYNQDSAYEYFPKQYLLLGGLEPKYRTIHENAVQAVKKHLLFRPLIKDNDRSILFSGKAKFRFNEIDESLSYEYEVTHLACFLGGMFGLGAKIFNLPEDLEIGKRLIDGCVWAYESMPTGIMPEYALMAPCADLNECLWNETLWYEQLDPQWEYRAELMEKYQIRMREWKREVERLKHEHELRQTAEERARRGAAAKISESTSHQGERSSLQQYADQSREGSDETATTSTSRKIDAQAKTLDEQLSFTNSLGQDGLFGGVSGQVPLFEASLPEEPSKPLTHEEFISTRLKNEHIPEGFTRIIDKRYLLRPEAIESVWYMYRITGDPIWQEKGWKMWQDVVAATRNDVAHSAIDDVTSEVPSQTDTMESFWIAETLKYFYLLFAPPETISLDEWVLNTEAHPFKRPT